MATVHLVASVDKHFSKGIRVIEKDGNHDRRWTVWTSERPDIGSAVTVTGDLRQKVGEYDGKHYVEASINNATIAPQTGAQGPTEADPWLTDATAMFDANAPF